MPLLWLIRLCSLSFRQLVNFVSGIKAENWLFSIFARSSRMVVMCPIVHDVASPDIASVDNLLRLSWLAIDDFDSAIGKT
jgi:hypothetical protein